MLPPHRADGICSDGAARACGSHHKGPSPSFLLHVPVYLTSVPQGRCTPQNAGPRQIGALASAQTQHGRAPRSPLRELRGDTGDSTGPRVRVRSGCRFSVVSALTMTSHANNPLRISKNTVPRNAILVYAARPEETSGPLSSGPEAPAQKRSPRQ